jgi:sigma54-dependent transcription regulator
MNVPDIEFTVILQPHTTAGREWLAQRMMAKNDMVNGVVVRSVECASLLGDEAVAAGLRISGFEVYSFEGPNIDRSAR